MLHENMAMLVCDRTASLFTDRENIFVTESSLHYQGDGSC